LDKGMYVEGKYRIIRKIGQGGMSCVYLAVEDISKMKVAVKEVKKNNSGNPELFKCLYAEIHTLRKLTHPNLPKILDVVESNDRFFIVMDYIEGKTLSEVLEESGAQTQENVVIWSLQLCGILEYLHSRVPPIVYKDLKPSNVILKPEGKIVLIDFGTAGEYKSGNKSDTTNFGTVGYAAPEQFSGMGKTDIRTDIYCLGMTMYHLVTGLNPGEVKNGHHQVRKINHSISREMEKIIEKCTRKNPDDRYGSVSELIYVLEHLRGGKERKIEKFHRKKRGCTGKNNLTEPLCFDNDITRVLDEEFNISKYFWDKCGFQVVKKIKMINTEEII